MYSPIYEYPKKLWPPSNLPTPPQVIINERSLKLICTLLVTTNFLKRNWARKFLLRVQISRKHQKYFWKHNIQKFSPLNWRNLYPCFREIWTLKRNFRAQFLFKIFVVLSGFNIKLQWNHFYCLFWKLNTIFDLHVEFQWRTKAKTCQS